MNVWQKLTVLLCIYGFVPTIVALLYRKIKKHSFIEGLLYSVVSMLMMPVAMESLGSVEFKEFLLSDEQAPSKNILSIFRLTAFSVVFCLGGSAFISRIYEMVTGQKLKQFEEKIAEVQEQAQKIAVAVVANAGSSNTEKVAVRQLLEHIRSENRGVLISDLPAEQRALFQEILSLGAIRSITDKQTLETRFAISDIGLRFLANDLNFVAR